MLDKVRGEAFLLAQHRRQVLGEPANVSSQLGLALRIEGIGDRHPSIDDGLASFDELRSGGISVCLGLVEFLCYLLHGGKQRCGLSVALRAETSVASPVAISAARNPWGGVRGDPLLPHHPREILPPLAQQCVALHVNLDKTADLTKETSSVQAASIKRC
jgi:hypothetical protein